MEKVKNRRNSRWTAAALTALMLIPQTGMTAAAAVPAPVYAHEEKAEVESGEGALTVENDVVDTMKNSEDVTVNLTFTASGSSVESLFFMGDKDSANNYIALYVKGSTLGVESRNESGAQQISGATYAMTGTDLGEQHTLTFVMDGNDSYSFWLDGEEVKTGALSCAFNTGLTASDYIGFGNGARNGNTYPLTGTLENVELYNAALADEEILSYHNGGLEDLVYASGSGFYPDGTEDYETVTDTAAIDKLHALEQGSITVRYRLAEDVVGKDVPQMLMALSDSKKQREYAGLYVNPAEDVIGLDAQGGSDSVLGNKKISLGSDKYESLGLSVNDTEWHTITVTKDPDVLKFYVDGVYVDRFSKIGNGFLSTVTDPDTLAIGRVARSQLDGMEMTGAVDTVKIYSSVLGELEISRDHAATCWTPGEETDMTDAYKSETQDLFYPDYEGSFGYRIPSLLTTQEGTQLAFADMRNTTLSDYGDIDAVVRRREADGGFSDPIKMIDLPDNGGSAAFAIDMATVQDKETGRIFAFVDMFPESSGLMDAGQLTTGTGYEEADGKMCQILYTDGESGREKAGWITTVEDGIGHVLGVDGEDTGYTVVVNPYEAGASLEEKGNLYKDGEYKGNIYMLKDGPDKGELTVLNTCYLWMVTSDDDGRTWSDPVDITPQVKEDWALFFGTGPGAGIQLGTGEYAGRLVIPVYTANANVSGSQSSAVIYSDDHGETWTLGESPQKVMGYDRATMSNGGAMFTESQAVQLENGNVLLFMRNTYPGDKVYVAVSTDGGATWDSAAPTDLTDVYCQLSVVQYTKGDGEYILLSNPSLSGRKNGKLHLGEVKADGSIEWKWEREVNGADERYAYSCLSLIEADETDPVFGLLYEDETNSMHIKYVEFDENYIKAEQVTQAEMKAPALVSKDVRTEGGKTEISLTFDQILMAAGEPKLSLGFGDKEIEAAYTGGSGSSTITFTAEGLTGSGILTLNALDLSAGLLENLQNKSPELNDIELYSDTEIDLTDAEVTVTSQHSASTAPDTDGAGKNAVDGNENTYWHSVWGNSAYQLPQSLTLELSEAKTIYRVDYLPRQNQPSGRIREYGLEVSMDGENFTEVAHGTLPNTTEWQEIEIVPAEAAYVRLTAYEAWAGGGTESCAVAELKLHEYYEGAVQPGDTAELKALADTADSLVKDDYSQVTWETYTAARKAAEELLEQPEGTVMPQGVIDRAAQRLEDAYNSLVDITRAKEKIREIKAEESRYTPASWEGLEQWIAENEPKLQQADSPRDVTDLIAGLVFEAGRLTVKPDKSALEELLEAYTVTDPLEKDGYDADSWSSYEEALAEAQEVMEDENADADAVNKAVTALTAARTELKADLSELQRICAAYRELKEADYTETSWAALEKVLEEAEAVIASGSQKPAEVKTLTERLNSAREALVRTAVVESLRQIYEELAALDPDDYTEESAQALAEALEAAGKVLAEPESDEQIYRQIEALKAAAGELELNNKDGGSLEDGDPDGGQTGDNVPDSGQNGGRPATGGNDGAGKGSAADTDKAVQTGVADQYVRILLIMAASAAAAAAAVVYRRSTKDQIR